MNVFRMFWLSKHSVVRLRCPVRLGTLLVKRMVSCKDVVSPRRAPLTRDAGSGRNPFPHMRMHIIPGYMGRVTRKVTLVITIGYEPTIHGWKAST